MWEKGKPLKPSSRGDLEITDVNNAYIREGTMAFSYLDGWWTDAGTFESLLRAANLVPEPLMPTSRFECALTTPGQRRDRGETLGRCPTNLKNRASGGCCVSTRTRAAA